jgi:hypothetical protein
MEGSFDRQHGITDFSAQWGSAECGFPTQRAFQVNIIDGFPVFYSNAGSKDKN